MDPWTIIEILQIGCMIIMILIVVGIFAQRLKSGKGLTARSIQFLSVGLLIPTILILAINKTLASETTAALLGGLAGYLLSDIGRYEPKESDDKHHTQENAKNEE